MKIRVHMTPGDIRRLFLFRYFSLMKMQVVKRYGGPFVTLLGALILFLKPVEYPFLMRSRFPRRFFASGSVSILPEPFLACYLARTFRMNRRLELREKGMVSKNLKVQDELPTRYRILQVSQGRVRHPV
jgi:hypothetical protein